MLSLIAFSTVLMQDPSAPTPPPPVEVRSHLVFTGAGPGRLDADGDGQITREEFAAPLNDAFAKLDKDGDGRLSAEELPSGREDADVNVTVRRRGGGDVERLELRRPGPGGARFERDGERTMVFVGPEGRDEDSRVIVRTLPRGGPAVVHFRRGPAGDGLGHVVVRASDISGEGSDGLDKDGDGKISEAEFLAPLREAFARMDADRSGFIEDGEHGGGNQVHVFTRRLETRDEE
ncbi:hypothetical protein [Brevundimonas sp.]|uniref:hypothetical protein n=1 Tax=Brevundimonas sp. TaxID=1871086 RepID=UPI003F6EE14C